MICTNVSDEGEGEEDEENEEGSITPDIFELNSVSITYLLDNRI